MKQARFISASKLGVLWFAGVSVLLISVALQSQERNVDDFFRDFTADWVRHDPDLATRTRYFSGEEQRQLERELTPQTTAWRLDRIQRAKRALAQLRGFDRSRMTDTERVSADLMEWQLDLVVREEPYLDSLLSKLAGVEA